MSDTKEEVWQAISGELTRRRRRSAGRRFVVAATFLVAVYLSARIDRLPPRIEAPDRVVHSLAEETKVGPGPATFAVLVYGNEGMRFELLNASELDSGVLQFNLEPVVWSDSERW